MLEFIWCRCCRILEAGQFLTIPQVWKVKGPVYIHSFLSASSHGRVQKGTVGQTGWDTGDLIISYFKSLLFYPWPQYEALVFTFIINKKHR
jgi:hypothetical protein